MIYVPEKDGKAKKLAFGFMLIGISLFCVGSTMSLKWIPQVVGLVMIVTGLQFLTRFVMSDFRYIIEDSDDGGADLLVFKKQGRSDVKVCHVSLFYVTDVYRHSEKKQKCDKVYSYVQNSGVDGWSVIYEDGDRLCEVIIEADEVFVDAIRQRIGKDGDGTKFAM